jgi:hypothetical protein
MLDGVVTISGGRALKVVLEALVVRARISGVAEALTGPTDGSLLFYIGTSLVHQSPDPVTRLHHKWRNNSW